MENPRNAEATCRSWKAVMHRLQPPTMETKAPSGTGDVGSGGGGWVNAPGCILGLLARFPGTAPLLKPCPLLPAREGLQQPLGTPARWATGCLSPGQFRSCSTSDAEQYLN